MKNLFLMVLMPALIIAKVNILPIEKDNFISISNLTDNNITIHTDIGSIKLAVNQGMMLRCYSDETKYISIEQETNEDFDIFCSSKLYITND